MRKQIVLSMLSLAAINVAAQDIIVMRNGDEVEAKVTKVGTTEVEYHKWSNQYGPVYTAAKSDVFMIKYKNGEKDMFDNVTAKSDNSPKSESNSSVPQYVEAVPAANNQEQINMYNTEVNIYAGAEKKSDSDYCFPILGIASTSILSTNEARLRIVPTIIFSNIDNDYHLRYSLEITNKTDRFLYVDLANSFRINQDGKSESYYKCETTTVSSSNSSGIGMNLGGITNALGIGGALGTLANAATVGSGSQGGVSTTYENNRFLTIAPHSKQFLQEFKEVNVKGSSYKLLSDIEYYLFNFGKRGYIKKNEVISYTEQNSPLTTSHMIIYSTEQDFSTYSALKANLYVRKVFGGKYKNSGFSPMSGRLKPETLLKNIQQFIPDYSLDSSIIIGTCQKIE